MPQLTSLHQCIHVDKTNLVSLQKQSEKPILVKFVAPHCAGCMTLKPLIEELTKAHLEQLYLVEIDITEDPELAIDLDVRSVPTVALFKGEEELGRLVGLQPKKHYVNLVQQAV